MIKPPKKISSFWFKKGIFVCISKKKLNKNYILLSEHEKELTGALKSACKEIDENADLKRQLVEKDKEIKSNCNQHETERQELKKVIEHWKRSYNQAADERNEAKQMLLAMAKRLPIPKNVKMVKMK